MCVFSLVDEDNRILHALNVLENRFEHRLGFTVLEQTTHVENVRVLYIRRIGCDLSLAQERDTKREVGGMSDDSAAGRKATLMPR